MSLSHDLRKVPVTELRGPGLHQLCALKSPSMMLQRGSSRACSDGTHLLPSHSKTITAAVVHFCINRALLIVIGTRAEMLRKMFLD